MIINETLASLLTKRQTWQVLILYGDVLPLEDDSLRYRARLDAKLPTITLLNQSSVRGERIGRPLADARGAVPNELRNSRRTFTDTAFGKNFISSRVTAVCAKRPLLENLT
jgi:hypothetical protein